MSINDLIARSDQKFTVYISELQFSFPPRSKNGKKTQHGVVGPENRREDLRDRAQSIGDGFNASENTPVARSTPNSLGERFD